MPNTPGSLVFICYDFDHDHTDDFFIRDLGRLGNGRFRFVAARPPRPGGGPLAAMGQLAANIKQAAVGLVVVGNHANSFHRDRLLLGERNWQWWMIRRIVDAGLPLAGVRIEPRYEEPRILRNHPVAWAGALDPRAVLAAVAQAMRKPPVGSG